MATELTLHLERALPAPRPLVFQMHTDPDLLTQWWGPKGFSTPSIELDLCIGGAYRIEMQPPNGDRFLLSGEFRVIEPPIRLAYTFRWCPPDPDDRETLVSISFADRGDSSSLALEQGPFATEERRALHQQGWCESLDRLGELIRSRGRLGSSIEGPVQSS